MTDAEHRFAMPGTLDRVFQLRDKLQPALGRRIARVGAERLDRSEAVARRERVEQRRVARRRKAVGVGKLERRPARAQAPVPPAAAPSTGSPMK
jgi:hypothetical protein